MTGVPGVTGVHGWPEEQAATFAELRAAMEALASVGHGPFRTYAFRGQPDIDRSLRPSLCRAIKDYELQTDKRIASLPNFFESAILNLFKQGAHLYEPLASLIQKDSLDWMVLGRHHGLPTRLLDWTYSPYVAAWFAACEEPQKDGAIWCVSVAHVNAESPDRSQPLIDGTGEHLERLVRGFSGVPPELTFLVPRVHNQRSAQQQGLFSIAARGDTDHDTLIEDILAKHKGLPIETHKIVRIPSASKRVVMRKLRTMNVTATALSPDLDGFCRELHQVLRDHLEELSTVVEEAVKSIDEDDS